MDEIIGGSLRIDGEETYRKGGSSAKEEGGQSRPWSRRRRFTAPIRTALEKSLAWIQGDGLAEVTPKSIRVRKAILDANDRKRAGTERPFHPVVESASSPPPGRGREPVPGVASSLVSSGLACGPAAGGGSERGGVPLRSGVADGLFFSPIGRSSNHRSKITAPIE
ncbi:hypothetical protein HB375_03730 [Microvirga sp. c23x22]|uniref:TypA/BipA C-terminal domain-containing protein n=1 Tax=Microvirga terricola TaxID=2719797 RepID=A0ABX0V942_9HYPH|nr:hypothetical protein [Microvirga terricola]NIX75724.1 hypothetical protein [Microvirga terricola]